LDVKRGISVAHGSWDNVEIISNKKNFERISSIMFCAHVWLDSFRLWKNSSAQAAAFAARSQKGS